MKEASIALEVMEADACGQKLKVLADRTRLAVVQLLLERPLRVGEINSRIEIDQSLLSHHLRILRDAGIVESERRGKGVLYRLSKEIAPQARQTKAIDLGCCRLSFD